MRRTLLAALALLLAAAPPAHAQADEGIDHVILIEGGGAPAGGGDALALTAHEPGERYAWNVTLERDYTTVEIRLVDAVDVERPRQVVPMLEVAGVDYPLFRDFVSPEVWDVDGPARVAHIDEVDGAIRVRLGLPGPANGTLTLARDVTPPVYTVGPRTALTHYSFYQETTTEELARADVQVRKVGTTEWVQNPTPEFHVLQKFPVQGFDADTEYETRIVFTDWAGNSVTTPIETFRTLPQPVVPRPSVLPIAPAPSSTANATDPLTISAYVVSNESPIADIRLFLDLQEVRADLTYEADVLRFTPPALTPGFHVVYVEALNEAGGNASARWTFTIADASASRPASTPAPPLALIVLAGVAAAFALRGGAGPGAP